MPPVEAILAWTVGAAGILSRGILEKIEDELRVVTRPAGGFVLSGLRLIAATSTANHRRRARHGLENHDLSRKLRTVRRCREKLCAWACSGQVRRKEQSSCVKCMARNPLAGRQGAEDTMLIVTSATTGSWWPRATIRAQVLRPPAPQRWGQDDCESPVSDLEGGARTPPAPPISIRAYRSEPAKTATGFGESSSMG